MVAFRHSCSIVLCFPCSGSPNVDLTMWDSSVGGNRCGGDAIARLVDYNPSDGMQIWSNALRWPTLFLRIAFKRNDSIIPSPECSDLRWTDMPPDEDRVADGYPGSSQIPMGSVSRTA